MTLAEAKESLGIGTPEYLDDLIDLLPDGWDWVKDQDGVAAMNPARKLVVREKIMGPGHPAVMDAFTIVVARALEL